MKTAVIIICFVIFIISMKKYGNLYNPVSVFSFIFLLFAILSCIQMYGLFEAESRAYLIVGIGVICYAIGAFFHKTFYIKKRVHSDFDVVDKICELDTNYKFYLYLLVVASTIEIVLCLPSVRYIISGHSFYDMRYVAWESIYASVPYVIRLLSSYLAIPLLFICIPISLIELIVYGRKLLFLLSIFCSLVWIISNGARMPAVYILVYIFAVFPILDYTYNLKSLRKKIVLYFFAGIVIIYLLSLKRWNEMGVNVSFVESMYRYFTGAMVNLSDKTENIDSFSYGASTLYGYANILDIFKELLKISSSRLIEDARELLDLIQNEVVPITESGHIYNFGVTGFLFFYKDFGYVGVVFFSFLFGIVSDVLYCKTYDNSDFRYLILYAMTLLTEMMFSITNMFANVSFSMAFLYLFIATKNKWRLCFENTNHS